MIILGRSFEFLPSRRKYMHKKILTLILLTAVLLAACTNNHLDNETNSSVQESEPTTIASSQIDDISNLSITKIEAYYNGVFTELEATKENINALKNASNAKSDYSNIKITFQAGIFITDDKGNRYKFGNYYTDSAGNRYIQADGNSNMLKIEAKS